VRWDHAMWYGSCLGRRRKLLVRMSNLSCEAETCCGETETCRVRRRLVVRGGDSSERVPLAANWSEKLPTSREPDVLPVLVLTGVLSPPRLESCLHVVNGVRRLHLKRD
jgi:hypothetical protein